MHAAHHAPVSCDYKSNMEVATSVINTPKVELDELKKVYTPNVTTINDVASFLNLEETTLLKASVFSVDGSDKALIVFLRGDLQVNEAKVQKVVKVKITVCTFIFIGHVGCVLKAYQCGPVGKLSILPTY